MIIMMDEIFELVMKEAQKGPTDDLKDNFLLVLYGLVDRIDTYLLSVGKSRFIFSRDELRKP